MFAIVLTVFRGNLASGQSTKKKKPGPPKPFCVEIAAPLCAQVHVVVLDRTGHKTFEATPVSPVLRLDPHTDYVMAQVPASHFKVHAGNTTLTVEVNEQCIEGLKALQEAKPTLATTAFQLWFGPCFHMFSFYFGCVWTNVQILDEYHQSSCNYPRPQTFNYLFKEILSYLSFGVAGLCSRGLFKFS